MPPGKASMMKKMSALVRDPSVIGMGSNNNRHNSQSSKPENLLQQQQREQQQQQQRVPSRQAIADAAKQSFVKGTTRFAPPHPPPTSGIPAPPRRASSHPEAPQEKRNGGALWEESTVGSALDDSRGSNENPRAFVKNKSIPVAARNSYHDPPATGLPKPENALFTINPDGRFTLANEQQRRNLASGVQSALERNTLESPQLDHVTTHHNHHLSDSAADIKQPQPRSLTRARLPIRDREPKRTSFVERTTGYPPTFDPMGISSSKPTFPSATFPYDDGATKAFDNPRSTIFQLSDSDEMAEPNDDEAEDEDQRTPRPNRYPDSQSPTKAVTRQHSPPKYGYTRGLQESVLPRNTYNGASSREHERVKKRKNMDLDYDENSLKKMNYSSLRDEPFDYDPAIGASPTRSSRNSIAIGDRLRHYKSKDTNAQADFFKTLTVNEWEEAGDWFLDQFSAMIGQLKSARQTKRQLCKEFEDEVERRHAAVQSKMEVIDHTLQKMRSEGEIMMKDKDID